nr:hypothetical protein A3J42_08560 [uncultured bacterium]
MTGRLAAEGRELAAAARYAAALPGFLRRRTSLEESRSRIRDAVGRREEQFLDVLDRAVYGNPTSPYVPLLRAAGAELGDVERLVRADGLEAALGRLADAGVFLTLEEFKGLRPIERVGASLHPDRHAFDNPLMGSAVTRPELGSRGTPRRVIINLDDIEHTAAYSAVFLEAFGLRDRPTVLWRPPPPARAGVGHVIQLAKLGKPVDAWFSQTPLTLRRGAKDVLFTLATRAAVRSVGLAAPHPVHVPLERADVVARWMAGRRGAHLNAPAGSAVRVCLAAAEHGLDLSGSFVRVGGEPLTAAKAEVFERAGAAFACHYTTSDAGRLGIACAAPAALDDVHLTIDRFAVVQRERALGPAGPVVGALAYTTLAPSVRRILINVEIGDYGVLDERSCGCAFDEIGLSQHLHTIRSFEKLATEGMHFLGPDLLRLVEEVLPARFGGEPTDYQLVEVEIGGLTKLEVVVGPRVGPVADAEVIATVLETLGDGPAFKTMMAEVWRDGETVRVVRREPQPTASGKILPLHVDRPEPVAAVAATVRVPRKGGGPDVTDSSTGSGGTSG